MASATDNISSLLGTLFDGLNIRTRWIVLVAIMGAIGMTALGFEWLTGHFYYQGLQQKVMLLKELHALSKDRIESNPRLKNIHEQLADELETRRARTISLSPLRAPSAALWKWLSGASVGLFAMALAFLGAWHGDQRRQIVIGAVFFVIVFGTVAIVLPTIIHPGVNYALLPLVQVLGLYLYNKRT